MSRTVHACVAKSLFGCNDAPSLNYVQGEGLSHEKSHLVTSRERKWVLWGQPGPESVWGLYLVYKRNLWKHFLRISCIFENVSLCWGNPFLYVYFYPRWSILIISIPVPIITGILLIRKGASEKLCRGVTCGRWVAVCGGECVWSGGGHELMY